MKQQQRYKISAIIRLILGLIVLIITYTCINVYEDPIIALSLSFLWVFIIARWASFFLFLWEQKIFHKNKDEDEKYKDSYKLSLLFWIFCILNVLLIVWWHRNKLIGLWLLIVFIIMQIFLFEKKDGKQTN